MGKRGEKKDQKKGEKKSLKQVQDSYFSKGDLSLLSLLYTKIQQVYNLELDSGIRPHTSSRDR